MVVKCRTFLPCSRPHSQDRLRRPNVASRTILNLITSRLCCTPFDCRRLGALCSVRRELFLLFGSTGIQLALDLVSRGWPVARNLYHYGLVARLGTMVPARTVLCRSSPRKELSASLHRICLSYPMRRVPEMRRSPLDRRGESAPRFAYEAAREA